MREMRRDWPENDQQADDASYFVGRVELFVVCAASVLILGFDYFKSLVA